jgi:2-haloacid dehalogenase
MTLSGPYTTFFSLAQGVLKMLGSIYSVSVQHADIEELRMRMLTMPAHPDVPAGLKQRTPGSAWSHYRIRHPIHRAVR